MSATESLLHLLGAVALLLWGLHMVRTGIIRAFGAQLRHFLSRSTANRGRAFLSGVGVTMIVQSSTATALIITSFVARGFMETAPALAIMLGADIATALVAQILSFNLTLLSPILILTGVAMHKSLSQSAHRQIGRASIGLGLMLLALGIIVGTLEPLRSSQVIKTLFAALADDPLIALVLAALLTWLAHSSLAAVLLVMSFVSTGIMSVELALIMVLGANLGGVLTPIMATLSQGPLAHRVTFGNAAFKLIGVLICLPLISLFPPLLAQIESSTVRQVVDFHMIFNLLIAGIFIFLVPAAAKLFEQFFPQRDEVEGPDKLLLLDPTAIETPVVALSCAARETLRMGEYVETMIQGVKTSLDDNDIAKTALLIEMDDEVDNAYKEIKHYVAKVACQEVDEKDSHRIAEIMSFTTNLEYMGDLAENLLELTNKKARKELEFSVEGREEIDQLHEKIAANLKLAMTVFMSGNVEIARQLVSEKRMVNALERRGNDRHMERLREGRRECIETSTLYMDMLRDLRRIHSHIAAVAYPILDAAGELRKTRLKKHS